LVTSRSLKGSSFSDIPLAQSAQQRHAAAETASLLAKQLGKAPFHSVDGIAYLMNMTKLLQKDLEAVWRLPPDSRGQIALAMLSLSGNEGEPEEVDPAHLPAVLEGLAQAKRHQFATDAEVEAAFRRFEQ